MAKDLKVVIGTPPLLTLVHPPHTPVHSRILLDIQSAMFVEYQDQLKWQVGGREEGRKGGRKGGGTYLWVGVNKLREHIHNCNKIQVTMTTIAMNP